MKIENQTRIMQGGKKGGAEFLQKLCFKNTY